MPSMVLTGGSVATTIDTAALDAGITSGVNSMVQNFLTMLGDVIPVAFPILGVTVGIYFTIRLVRRFMA